MSMSPLPHSSNPPLHRNPPKTSKNLQTRCPQYALAIVSVCLAFASTPLLGAEAAGPIATGTFKGREVVKLDAFVIVQTCADNLSPQHQFLRLGSLCKRQTFAETLTLMKLPDMENARTIVSTWLALGLTPLFGAEAAGPNATATIEGRVLNVDNGRATHL